MAEQHSTPRVHIGLPVYNGDNYVAAAIESILAQTYTDFELIVCDNASTDGTEEICRSIAARDPRVRYHRNETNLGAAANYNRCFELSSAEYFKWQAHDDTITPDFLEKCIAALDADPEAVLCQGLVGLMDEHGETSGTYDSRLIGSGSPRPSDRFAATALILHMGTEFFGLIRRSALENSPLHGTYHGSDQVLVTVLAMRGRFIQIRDVLFMNRSHPDRYSDGVRVARRSDWHDTSGGKHARFPLWRQYREYIREVRRNVPPGAERWRCYWHLVRWWGVNWYWARMLVELLVAIDPRFFKLASSIKRRLFGLADIGIDWEKWRKEERR